MAAYLIIVLGFVADQEAAIRCKSIDVKIVDKTKNQFVESSDIISMFKKNDVKILGYPFDSLNLTYMEEMLLKEQHSVKNAEIYASTDGILHVKLAQRNPILRIINNNKTSYYIDEEGALMRLSDKYASHVIIANGQINKAYDQWYKTDVSKAPAKDISRKDRLLYDLYTLAEFITADKFWSSQIQQIYVNSKNEFELIPMVGDHIIEFGTIENYKEKFRNLMLMYTQGFRSEGWNKYKKINLKYKNQVVCLKKETL